MWWLSLIGRWIFDLISLIQPGLIVFFYSFSGVLIKKRFTLNLKHCSDETFIYFFFLKIIKEQKSKLGWLRMKMCLRKCFHLSFILFFRFLRNVCNVIMILSKRSKLSTRFLTVTVAPPAGGGAQHLSLSLARSHQQASGLNPLQMIPAGGVTLRKRCVRGPSAVGSTPTLRSLLWYSVLLFSGCCLWARAMRGLFLTHHSLVVLFCCFPFCVFSRPQFRLRLC